MAYTTPTTHVAGETLPAADWNVVVGDIIEIAPFFSAFTAYTPSAIGGGITIGNGTFDAAFLKVGLLVIVRIRFTMGSTSSIGNSPAFTLPVAAASRVLAIDGALYDVSATTYYPCIVEHQNTDRIGFQAINAASTFAVGSIINATAPFTWATGDQFYANVMYTSST